MSSMTLPPAPVRRVETLRPPLTRQRGALPGRGWGCRALCATRRAMPLIVCDFSFSKPANLAGPRDGAFQIQRDSMELDGLLDRLAVASRVSEGEGGAADWCVDGHNVYPSVRVERYDTPGRAYRTDVLRSNRVATQRCEAKGAFD